MKRGRQGNMPSWDPGDAKGTGGAQRVVLGMHTSLGLILLTFMVYLLSLANFDEYRRMSVYASLAKAFMTTDQAQTAASGPDNAVRLLSAGNQAMQGVLAYLSARPTVGDTAWVGNDFEVTLLGRPDTGLLARVAALAAASDSIVQVTAYAALPIVPGAAIARAVAVAQQLLNSNPALDERNVSGVGQPVPYVFSDGFGSGADGHLTLVLRNLKDTL